MYAQTLNHYKISIQYLTYKINHNKKWVMHVQTAAKVNILLECQKIYIKSI